MHLARRGRGREAEGILLGIVAEAAPRIRLTAQDDGPVALRRDHVQAVASGLERLPPTRTGELNSRTVFSLAPARQTESNGTSAPQTWPPVHRGAVVGEADGGEPYRLAHRGARALLRQHQRRGLGEEDPRRRDRGQAARVAHARARGTTRRIGTLGWGTDSLRGPSAASSRRADRGGCRQSARLRTPLLPAARRASLRGATVPPEAPHHETRSGPVRVLASRSPRAVAPGAGPTMRGNNQPGYRPGTRRQDQAPHTARRTPDEAGRSALASRESGHPGRPRVVSRQRARTWRLTVLGCSDRKFHFTTPATFRYPIRTTAPAASG